MNYHPTPKSVIPKSGVPPIDSNINSYLQSDGLYYRVCRDESLTPYFQVWKNNKWNDIWTTCGSIYNDYITCLESDSIKSAKKRTIITTILLLSGVLFFISVGIFFLI